MLGYYIRTTRNANVVVENNYYKDELNSEKNES